MPWTRRECRRGPSWRTHKLQDYPRRKRGLRAREAEAGRVPHLKAGKVFLFDPEAVERVLLERARQEVPNGR